MKKWINLTQCMKLPLTHIHPFTILVDIDSITSVHFYKDLDKEVYGICVWVREELNPYVAEYVDKNNYLSSYGKLMFQLGATEEKIQVEEEPKKIRVTLEKKKTPKEKPKKLKRKTHDY